jgi:hypothetical protein
MHQHGQFRLGLGQAVPHLGLELPGSVIDCQRIKVKAGSQTDGIAGALCRPHFEVSPPQRVGDFFQPVGGTINAQHTVAGGHGDSLSAAETTPSQR